MNAQNEFPAGHSVWDSTSAGHSGASVDGTEQFLERDGASAGGADCPAEHSGASAGGAECPAEHSGASAGGADCPIEHSGASAGGTEQPAGHDGTSADGADCALEYNAVSAGEVSDSAEEVLPLDEIRGAVYARLNALGIAFRRVRHAPAASLAECAAVSKRLGAVICKNYFLTTKSQKHYCLCVVRPEARLRTADVSKQAGTPRLTFAGEDALFSMLHERPGSVSPFGLIFDSARPVRLLMDRGLAELPELAFHPCDNTETLAVSTADFLEKFLPDVGKAPEWVEIHDFMNETEGATNHDL